MKQTSRVGIAAIILLVGIGVYNNSRQITRLKPVLIDHDLPSPSGRAKRKTIVKIRDESNAAGLSEHKRDSCLKARKDTVPSSMYGKLPRPYVNLGFPKMGTSSLHAFFQCGGLKSFHFRCGKNLTTKRQTSCSKCITDSISAHKPPLALCEEADMFAQIDNGTYFPQVELMHEFHEGYPQATFFLTFRNMTKWYHSLSNWPPRPRGPHMNDRFKKFDITGFPTGTGNNEEEFTEWFCNHVERVRKLVENSNHHLIEVDIEDETTGKRMGEMFEIDEGCWGHSNMNLNLHPDANTSEVSVSKSQAKLLKKQLDAGENNDDDNVEHDYADEQDDEKLSSINGDDGTKPDEEKYDAEETDSNQFSAACFKARNDTIPPSMFKNLSRPFINLGFPKMGTSSLNAFFKCGGYKAFHYTCGKGNKLCSGCIKQSVKMEQPPLSHCPDADAYTQLDDGRFFPQIELLEEFVEGYPQATFFLTFRSMESWYHSLSHWPPNRTKHISFTERLSKLDITGLPEGKGKDMLEISDWYCKHVERVRNMINKYPSLSLVEIDIEDSTAGHYLEKLFGIQHSCFGQKNVHAQRIESDNS